jgi:hypothetical protein
MKHKPKSKLKPARARKDDELEHGRQHYRKRAWADAYQALLLADQETPLEADDLELLAMAAYLVGRDDDYLRALERAHNAHLNAGQCPRAIRCAFWFGFRVLMRGRERLVCPCPTLAGRRRTRMRRAGLSAAADGRTGARLE